MHVTDAEVWKFSEEPSALETCTVGFTLESTCLRDCAVISSIELTGAYLSVRVLRVLLSVLNCALGKRTFSGPQFKHSFDSLTSFKILMLFGHAHSIKMISH